MLVVLPECLKFCVVFLAQVHRHSVFLVIEILTQLNAARVASD